MWLIKEVSFGSHWADSKCPYYLVSVTGRGWSVTYTERGNRDWSIDNLPSNFLELNPWLCFWDDCFLSWKCCLKMLLTHEMHLGGSMLKIPFFFCNFFLYYPNNQTGYKGAKTLRFPNYLPFCIIVFSC